MANTTTTHYSCDRCKKKLKTHSNNLNIVTTLSKPEDRYWSRIHIKIEHRSGVNNNADVENADLCKKCAVALLEDALKRVKGGERATEGTEEIDECGWDS